MHRLPKKQRRNRRGNLYVLYIGLAALIIVIWNLYAAIGLNMIVNYRSKCALEAASLAAARDLSRIVINDSKWGYIALTDQPPVGKDTFAADGYPLPVTGINTIIATARLELLVAQSLGTNEGLDCAMEDVISARKAARRLGRVLRNSLRNDNDKRSAKSFNNEDLIARDIHGKVVRPLDSARDVYEQNAKHLLSTLGWQLEGLNADLGALSEEGCTNTPRPEDTLWKNWTARESSDSSHSSDNRDLFADASPNYPAFKDVPVGDEQFYFAGLGKQVSLVESSLFETSKSGPQVCSILRLVAQLKRTGTTGTDYMKSVACAQPAFIEDKVPASYMVLRFPNGIPHGADSLRGLLTSRGMSRNIPLYTASGGDFPVDTGAQLKENPGKATATVRHAFTRAFFDWMRTAHAKPKLHAILDALDRQFARQHASTTYLFTFDDNGSIEIAAPENYPFTTQTAYENQLYTVAFNAINANGFNWSLRLRDQVHRLGKLEGGKHAGQPMPSTVPVNLKQDEEKRLLAIAGSRYDRSRLGLELEISNPSIDNGGSL